MMSSINSINQINAMVSELKAVNRRLVSNVYMPEDEMMTYISEGRVSFSYVEGAYLNLWINEDSFYNLLFYVASMENYRADFGNEKIVCELYGYKEESKDLPIYNKLQELGFDFYAEFHKWGTKQLKAEKTEFENIEIFEKREPSFELRMKQDFDIYTDHIPVDSMMEKYFSDKKCYSAYYNGAFAGGMILASKGNSQTIEYCFVDPAFQGRGVASALFVHWKKITDDLEKCNYISWINDQNKASIGMNSKHGFERQSTYKIVMQKNVDFR